MNREEPRQQKATKDFRLRRLNIRWINIDSENFDEDKGTQDIVISVTSEDGSKFEVERLRGMDNNGLQGLSTATAKLVVRRSWGDEGKEVEDPSVSCPICLFQGHGAQVCKDARPRRG